MMPVACVCCVCCSCCFGWFRAVFPLSVLLLLAVGLILQSHGGERFGLTVSALFAFFLAGFLLFFLVCCFLAVCYPWQYRRPGPCGHSHAFLACPPMWYWSTTPIPTIHGHPRASGLVCVLVASVHVCLWPCAHVVRSCACVFADVLGVQMCVLGVLCVNRVHKPNLEPGHKLFCTIFNLNDFFCVDQFEILRFLHKLT